VRTRQRLLRLAVRPHLPRRTVRLRLTLLYGGLFLLSGAALLAITYVLVVHATAGFIFSDQNGIGGIVRNGRPPAAAPAHGTIPSFGSLSVQSSSNGITVRAGGSGLTGRQAAAVGRTLTAQADRQHTSTLHALLIQSGIALAGMALLSIALGWLVAGRVLRPLRTITTAARSISATNLHERLALDGPNDELRELGDTFDGLLARLDASFQAQRRFVANASHELRTPLARQRALVQVALADPNASFESLRAAHKRVLASEEQLERLIEALLTLTRGQAGVARREPFDLASLTNQALLARDSEANRIGVDTEAALAPAPASGDPRLVERLIANLLDNALHHNIAGGHIAVTVETRDGRAVLSVLNTGPVVPATAVDRLFQPFQRLGADRTHHREGLGLGLSIVHAIADSHDATVAVQPQPEGGLRIEVSFPASPEPAGDPAARPPLARV
jgi:signal transduction histidine kinase